MADVPLVRTEGKSFADGATLTPRRLLREPQLLRASKTARTREVESRLGLGNSLYFYVGHACPDFGQMVFVFDAAWTDECPGTATPFDTGGLFGGYVKALGVEDAESAHSYCHDHRVLLIEWRSEFDAFIESHFESAVAYVLGLRATTDDPTRRLLDVRNQRRSWTWELQVHADHDLRQGLLLLCVPTDVADDLRSALLDLSDKEAADWDHLFDSPRYRVAGADHEAPMICRMAEEEIASWL